MGLDGGKITISALSPSPPLPPLSLSPSFSLSLSLPPSPSLSRSLPLPIPPPPPNPSPLSDWSLKKKVGSWFTTDLWLSSELQLHNLYFGVRLMCIPS